MRIVCDKVIEIYGTTQAVGILEQLEMGIRYLDFHVFYSSETGDFHNGIMKAATRGKLAI